MIKNPYFYKYFIITAILLVFFGNTCVFAAEQKINSVFTGANKLNLPGIEIRPAEYEEGESSPMPEVLKEPILPRAFRLTGDVLTLSDCLYLAYENNPEITEAHLYVQQYEAKVRQSLSLYVPNASLNLVYSDAHLPALNSSMDSSSASLQLSHVLYDSGKRIELVNAAQNALNASHYAFLTTWNQKAYQVTKAYYDLIYAYWLVGINEDDMSKTQENLTIAQGFYKTGSKARIDVTQAEMQLRTSEINLTSSRTALLSAYTNLISIIGADIKEIENRRIDDNLNYKPSLPDRDQLISHMRESNPNLSYYEYLRLSSLDMSKSYLADRLPIFSANAMWGAKNKWGLSDPSWTVSFQLSIPLLKNTESKAYADEQKAIAGQMESKAKTAILSLSNQIDTSLINIYSGIKRSEMAYRSAETAALNYKLSYLRYKQGVSTIIELNNAIDFLNNARLEYLKSLYDIRLADAALKQALGMPHPPSKE